MHVDLKAFLTSIFAYDIKGVPVPNVKTLVFR